MIIGAWGGERPPKRAMSRFEYKIPAAATVSRLFAADELQDDLFAVTIDGAQVAILNYDDARRFWLGHLSIQEILKDDKQIPGGRAL